ncbi:hypothetical protein BU23DRAFT_160278 [Bimuria novae-zelandiae CBS 107.79]|uniref:Uncharacterized protein n=1 Tax=Bimuria novae-zelandiae CBS 107.79 TaxID=1447943 RepID=A0A6A5V5Y6_9PLEO|nr:hypothetical protein BU23DRAFT_160278 [Bimuria novae-zelandiae CBS 107.79]
MLRLVGARLEVECLTPGEFWVRLQLHVARKFRLVVDLDTISKDLDAHSIGTLYTRGTQLELPRGYVGASLSTPESDLREPHPHIVRESSVMEQEYDVVPDEVGDEANTYQGVYYGDLEGDAINEQQQYYNQTQLQHGFHVVQSTRFDAAVHSQTPSQNQAQAQTSLPRAHANPVFGQQRQNASRATQPVRVQPEARSTALAQAHSPTATQAQIPSPQSHAAPGTDGIMPMRTQKRKWNDKTYNPDFYNTQVQKKPRNSQAPNSSFATNKKNSRKDYEGTGGGMEL